MPCASRDEETRRTRTFWVIAIVAALLGAGGAGPAVVEYEPILLNAGQGQKPKPTLWVPCPNNDREAAEHRVVRTFQRGPGAAPAATMPGGTSQLVCGNDAYGYYHIVNRHYVEWNEKSIKTSENWREVADYAISEALKNPQAITFRAPNNTFCYSREIYLVNKVTGAIVNVTYPNVVLRAQDGVIITAFPAGAQCRG
jgi:hypothetical protein